MDAIAPAQTSPLTGPALDNKRVAAALIDLVVLFFFGFLLGLLGGARTAGIDAIILAWALYYYFALESMTGQTVGKRVVGLKVVRADGSSADMRAIGIRTVLRVVDGFAFYLVGLVVMLATGERRQRLGDLVAGTVVTTADTPLAEDLPPAAPEAPVTPVPDFTAPEVPADNPFEPMMSPAVVETLPTAGPKEADVQPPGEPIVQESERALEPAPDPDDGAAAPEIKIVSPIDVVMEDGEDRQAGERPAPPPGDQAA
jgi:uncharacterized RDD family membrane protein YckC